MNIDQSQDYKSRIKEDKETAEKYLHRDPARHKAEMATIDRALGKLDQVKTFLDIPCGTGRASIFLASRGYQTVGADLGEGAVDISREEARKAGVDCRIEKNDLEAMSYDDNAFDAALCFRMFHHFPDDTTRSRAVAELCRVAKRYVLISYLNPWSLTSIKRRLRAALGGKRSRQHLTPIADLDKFFEPHDFTRIADIPVRKFLNSLHLAVYQAK